MVKTLKEIKAEKAIESLPPGDPAPTTVTLFRPVYQVQGYPLVLEDCFLYETAEEARTNPHNRNKTVVGVVPVSVNLC